MPLNAINGLEESLNSYSKEILDELNVECLNFDADNYENDKEHGLPKHSDTVRGG